MRPRRTVVFVTWDAEEWGIIGSIEWVEAHAERLRASVVAYVNQDAPVSGSSFGAAAAPELKSLARAAARRVADPLRGGSVYDAWLARVTETLDAGADPEPLPVGDLGGGSDHKGFYQRIGIPAIGFGFGGSSGVYHSMYDTSRWMEEFGDPGYVYHAAVARVAAVVMSRLANADILPYDFEELTEVVREHAGHVEGEVVSALAAAAPAENAVGDAGLELPADPRLAGTVRAALGDLESAIDSIEAAGRAYSEVRDFTLQREVPPGEARRANDHVRAASLSLTGDAGLPGDAWSRQLLFASDPDNGYATLPLPGVRLALRTGDLAETAERIGELAKHLRIAAGQLQDAARSLEGSGPAVE
jgi:N-acetylated-alpha-linked acidic dipeptidase